MSEIGRVVPLSFNLSALVRRSVASLYSHLVTRPTGQALRLGIESQIGELGDLCVSVLDFSEVVVLDYSCADEAVAKLIQRFQGDDRPAEAYFVARGITEHHLETLEEVLVRHKLALVAEVEPAGFTLLGVVSEAERRVWEALQAAPAAPPSDIALRLLIPEAEVAAVLESLARRRVAIGLGEPCVHYALSTLLTAA